LTAQCNRNGVFFRADAVAIATLSWIWYALAIAMHGCVAGVELQISFHNGLK
jgi:hypothetical protein